ncbi:MAG: hypothetical protein QF903_10575 [Planctomycetota bacterium]|nr:hypothetical protein [Planctomycetota bacterium]MDP6989912.1 hypothetical protein [Planctomycetota bacterium]
MTTSRRLPLPVQRALSAAFGLVLPLGLIAHLSLPGGPGVIASGSTPARLAPARAAHAGPGRGRARRLRPARRIAADPLARELRERAQLTSQIGPPAPQTLRPPFADEALSAQDRDEIRENEQHWPVRSEKTRKEQPVVVARVLSPPTSQRGRGRPARVRPADWIDAALNPRRGLEDGLTLERRGPLGRERGALRVVSLETDAALDCDVDERGEEVTLVDHLGERVRRIGGLEARDRRGRRVPARFAMNRGRLRIELDDEEAEYPIRVEPRRVEEEDREEKPAEERLLAGSKLGREGQAPQPDPEADARPAS